MRSNTKKELWYSTYHWLKKCGIRVSKVYCKKEIVSHPDYPALTAVTDFLDSGNMQFKMVKADASYIHEFHYPVLAHIHKPEDDYMRIVKNASHWDQEPETFRFWSGVVVYGEKGTNWSTANNTILIKKEKQRQLFIYTFFSSVLLFYLYAITRIETFSTVVLGLCSIIGFIISAILFKSELGFASKSFKKVCSAISPYGCEKVMSSKYARVTRNLTLADIAVVYFASQLLCWFTAALVAPKLFSVLFIFSYLGVLVVGWSIYIQAFKIKSWCSLCLALDVILILQAFFSYSDREYIKVFFAVGAYTLLLIPALFFFNVSVLTLFVKQFLINSHSDAGKVAKLERLKSDPATFINQWQKEKLIDVTEWEKDIIIGSPDAPLTFTVACNVFCNPCAITFEQLDEWLSLFAGTIKVQIRFLCDNKKGTDLRTLAAEAIFQKIYGLTSSDEIRLLLRDWYKKMDINKWKQRWEPDPKIDVLNMLQQSNSWIRQNQSQINYTPTIFLNGKKLPELFELNEIKIFIPKLKELFQQQRVQR